MSISGNIKMAQTQHRNYKCPYCNRWSEIQFKIHVANQDFPEDPKDLYKCKQIAQQAYKKAWYTMQKDKALRKDLRQISLSLPKKIYKPKVKAEV